MQPTPEKMVAVGALLRAIAARLLTVPYSEPLAEWGSALHDRFAPPVVLQEDLRSVLSDRATRKRPRDGGGSAS